MRIVSTGYSTVVGVPCEGILVSSVVVVDCGGVVWVDGKSSWGW